jgi:uncharacterized radical SAM superfamily Fe-S cluster-containing enzyme
MPSLGEKPKAIPQGKSLSELVVEMHEWAAKKKQAEADAEFAASMVHAIATKSIPPLLENLETDEFNVPDVARVELRQEVYVHVNKDDTQKFHDWLKTEGHGDLVIPYVFPATLKAFAGEQLAQNVALPDFMHTAFVPTAKLLAPRKGKKK